MERCVPGIALGPAMNTSACAYNWAFTESRIIENIYTEPSPYNPTAANPMQPSQIRVKLRPGVPLSVPIKVRRPAIPPLDFYLISDASASMGKFVDLVESGSNAIAAALVNISANSIFGLGAFLDKPIQPRGFWPWCFVFKEIIPLTSNITAFQNGARDFQVTYNYDHPESSLEPLMLAAWDSAGTIGWRSNSYRVIMVATDTSSFEVRYLGLYTWPPLLTKFQANDPFGIKIGKLPPNNGDGIADGWPPGTGEDYPTRDQVKAALVQNKVLPIFGVLAPQGSETSAVPYYTSVAEKFTFGTVVPFSDADQNAMVQGIVDGINNNLNRVVLAPEVDTHNRVFRIAPESGHPSVPVGGIRDFEVVLLAREGEESYAENSYVTLRYGCSTSHFSLLR